MEIEEQWLVHDGIKISYHHYYIPSSTPKPALVFVHGFLSSKFCYRFMIPELLDHFTIFTFDYPPFGNSEKVLTYNFSYKNFARIITELLDEHDIQTASIVGHSMGGQIALLSAHLYPDRIDKLILLAPSTYIKKASFFMHTVSKAPTFPYFLRRFLYRKGVYRALLDCVHDPHMVNKDMIQGYMQPFLQKDIYHCLSKMIRDREGDLPSHHLQEIKQECLVFWGKKDKVLPVSLGYKLVQDLPAASLETFEEIGHLLPEEVPLSLTEKIKEFCLTKEKVTSM